MRPDGRPHAAGIGALWLDGDLYFTSGPETAKARHLAANPACTISVRLQGIDLILEGDATRVADQPTLETAARLYRSDPAQHRRLARWEDGRSRRRWRILALGQHPSSCGAIKHPILATDRSTNCGGANATDQFIALSSLASKGRKSSL